MADTRHARLVVAAQHGDTRAHEELITAYLPLLYNIVGRALDGHADTDDVVQECLIRVVRELPSLRDPDSFRAWLAAIAIRQISTHRHRSRAAAARTAPLDEADPLADPGTDVETATVHTAHLDGERRELADATRWLDPQQRALLSLWWQENTGRMSRAEVADTLQLTVAHTGVRLQRLREQLDLVRRIAAALAARPRCAELTVTVAGWDGGRTPVWRKRIARHVRACPVCAATATNQVPVERLLASFTPLAVPAGLTAALSAKGLLSGTGAASLSAGAHASWITKILQGVAAHPVAGAATGAVVVAATAVTFTIWPQPVPPPPAVIATPAATALPAPSSAAPSPTPSPSASASPRPVKTSPSPAASTVALGVWSLESVDAPGTFVTESGGYAALAPITAASDTATRQRATFTVVAGLADPACITFRAADGRYLRHYELRLQLSPQDSTALFREDATFCPHPGATATSVTLQSHNYPVLVLRHRDGGFYIDGSDGSAAFARQSSFIVRKPWA